MIKINARTYVIAIIVCCSNPVYSLDIYSSAKPQSTGNNCQRYAAALALAAQNDPDYKMDTFGDLRRTERKFRELAEKYGSPYNHSNWDKALSELTHGRYTFERTYDHSDVVGWLEEVRSLTDVDSDLDTLLNKLSGQSGNLILTSVYALDGSEYRSGHIIAVLGVIGDSFNSNTRLVTFNSAIKGGTNEVGVCLEDDASDDYLPGDLKYSAGVVDTNNFELKGFDKYLIMRVVRDD